VEVGITISIYCSVSGDENDACFNAVEAGITKLITGTYLVMKTMRVSFKWKLEYYEEYVSRIISVHKNSIAMKFALFSSTDTCGRIRSVHPTSHCFHRIIRVDN